MVCEGSVITARGEFFNILYGERKDVKKINTIKETIANLTNYLDDFVVISFFNPVPTWEEGACPFEKDTIIFFQTIKSCTYNRLNYYDVEIRVDSKKHHRMYQRYVRKKEALKLFNEICVKKNFPDLSKWKKFYDSAIDGEWGDQEGVIGDEERAEISKNKEIVRKWWLNELPKEDFPIYFKALEYVSEKGWNSDVTYQEAYVEELEKLGLGNKIIEEFKDTTSPTILEIIGERYLNGTGGVNIDYKKAYRYFYHGERLGNMRCRYLRALMFKNGLHVKKNYNKYVKMIESILKEFLDAGGKNVLPCIDFAFVELAKIYKEKGDYTKSLEYAFKAKDLNDARIYKFLDVSKMPEILDIIYSIIPFDKNDMDIYDLLYLLKKPAKAKFYAKGKEYEIECVNLNGYNMVKFNDEYYKTIVDFFNKASIDGTKFYQWLENVDSVEVA